MDFPLATQATPKGPSISTAHTGLETSHYVVAGVKNFNTAAAWPSAGLAILIPFQLEQHRLVTQMAWQNGTITTAPTVDVGIYDRSLTREVSLGPTTQAGATGIQVGNIADTVLEPGEHYLAMSVSGTGSQFDSAATPAIVMRAIGCLQMAAASTLPATITAATFTVAYCPYLTLSSAAVL